MSNFIKINGIKIGEKFPPYVVAEMSANHNGDIKNAFKIIEYAKKCGASAIKIQTYKPDTITINSDKKDFIIKEGLWKGKTLYDLYKWAHTPWEWQKEIFEKLVKHIKKEGVLVTYCAKGEVKRILKALGMRVESLAGPPGKREMIRAIRL